MGSGGGTPPWPPGHLIQRFVFETRQCLPDLGQTLALHQEVSSRFWYWMFDVLFVSLALAGEVDDCCAWWF